MLGHPRWGQEQSEHFKGDSQGTTLTQDVFSSGVLQQERGQLARPGEPLSLFCSAPDPDQRRQSRGTATGLSNGLSTEAE